MKKLFFVFCTMMIVFGSFSVCSAERHRGEWHEHGGFNLFIGPAPFLYPYPAYPTYPDCERVCRDRVVPVCHYDSWGERWCHDEVVRDCRRVCY